MNEKPASNNNQKELFEQACQFIERIVDKKLAADEESHRESTRIQSRNTVGGILLVVVTLGVGAGGIIANGYAENSDRDHQVMRESNKRKLMIISDISNAITNIRETKDIILIYCDKKMTAEEKQKLNVERIKKRFELVKSSRPKLHFFTEKFRILIREFLAWDESINDYCSPTAPSETEWRKKQKDIEDQMILSPAQIFTDT